MIHFNSQPHKEADETGSLKEDLSNISTHSLTRRLTCGLSGEKDNLYFNSQPHKEADYQSDTGTISYSNFNSQPHKEADNILCTVYVLLILFQLTASQGG